MKCPSALLQGLLVVTLGLLGLPAWADDDCDAPLARWLSRDAVRQMALAKGWQIQRLKIDNGCYEIAGTDAQGRRFKAQIDPETLEVLKMKLDKHQRGGARDGVENGSERLISPALSNGAAVPAPLLPPGAAPSGRTD